MNRYSSIPTPPSPFPFVFVLVPMMLFIVLISVNNITKNVGEEVNGARQYVVTVINECPGDTDCPPLVFIADSIQFATEDGQPFVAYLFDKAGSIADSQVFGIEDEREIFVREFTGSLVTGDVR